MKEAHAFWLTIIQLGAVCYLSYIWFGWRMLILFALLMIPFEVMANKK